MNDYQIIIKDFKYEYLKNPPQNSHDAKATAAVKHSPPQGVGVTSLSERFSPPLREG